MHCVLNSKSEFHQHPVVRIVPLRGLEDEQGEAGGGQGRGGGRGRGRGQGAGAEAEAGVGGPADQTGDKGS